MEKYTNESNKTFFFETGQTISRSPLHNERISDLIGKDTLSCVAIF